MKTKGFPVIAIIMLLFMLQIADIMAFDLTEYWVVADVGVVQDIIIGDIDGDSDNEVIAAKQDGKILIYDGKTRMPIDSIIISSAYGYPNQVRISNIDNDPDLELIIGTTYNGAIIGHLMIYNAQSLLPEWISENIGCVSDIQIGDFDGDGQLEIFALTWKTPENQNFGQVLIVDGLSHVLEFQQSLPEGFVGEERATLASMDEDDHPEIIFSAHTEVAPISVKAYLFNGNPYSINLQIEESGRMAAFAFGDIDQDESNEILAVYSQGLSSELVKELWVLNTDWTEKWSYSFSATDAWGPVRVDFGDIDGDNIYEIFVSLNTSIFSGEISIINVLSHEEILRIGDLCYPEVLALGDIDDDIRPELCAGFQCGYSSGELIIFKGPIPHDSLYISTTQADITCQNIIVPVDFKCQTPTVSTLTTMGWDNPAFVLDSILFSSTATESWSNLIDIDNIDRKFRVFSYDTEGFEIECGWDTTLFYLYGHLDLSQLTLTDSICQDEINYAPVDSVTIIFDTTRFGGDSLVFIDTTKVPRPIAFVPEVRFNPIKLPKPPAYRYLPGDVAYNGDVNIIDIIYLINYKFKGGPEPRPIASGDVNGDCAVNIIDIIYLIDHKFKGGPAPVCGCVENPAMGACCDHGGIVSAEKIASATLMANYADGKTFISAVSPVDIRGMELILKVSDNPDMEITGKIENLQSYYSQKDGIVTLGLLDINGEGFIPAGEQVILEIDGQVEIIEALGADNNVQAVYFEIINNAAKTENLPTEFALFQNTPNPFNPVTEISFSLPVACEAKLEVYNILGQKVATLAEGLLEAGNHVARWDASSMASGMYLYRLEVGEYTASRKMLLLK